MNVMQDIGNRIRELRDREKLTQADLAAMMGVSRTAIAQWETGVRSPDGPNAARLAEHLKSSIDWIMRGDAPRPTEPPSLHERLARIARELQAIVEELRQKEKHQA